MSLSTVSLHQKNPFLIRKTRPRKMVSRSPCKLFGEALFHELGPHHETIDVRIGNQKMVLDIAEGRWITEETDETTIKSSNVAELKKRKHTLAKENNILRVKLDVLLGMLAEITAEEELQKYT